VNPRRLAVEDRALALADALESQHLMLAAHIREVVPETFGLCDEHLPLLRQALGLVSSQAPDHAAHSRQILEALDDLPRFIGRRGRVWIGRDRFGKCSAYWDDDEDWLEDGPTDVDLQTVLAWARRRSDDVRLPDDV
jgi:hypothetical protein